MENIKILSSAANLPWWRRHDALRRFVTHLIESELGRMRHGGALPALAPDQGAFDLVQHAGADSLELMALTAALAETLQLGQTGLLDGLFSDTRLDAWVTQLSAALDARACAPAITFRTSGSAGTPKPCEHELDTLLQEVAVLAGLLPGRRRIVSVVPAQHIYGFLFTILLPQQMRLPVLDVRGRVAATFWQALQPGDLVIGYPDFWQAALAGAASAQVPADVVGVSSSAPCPDALAQALLAAGVARLLQVYGSSETAGVGWRDQAAAAYRCFPYFQRAGDEEGGLLRQRPDGVLAPVPLQDRLVWDEQGGFLPAGRIDAAVQVGGINVFPARVAEVLREHPAVADVAVRRMRPDEGERLKAFVVMVASVSEQALTGQLDDWLRTRLSAPERPASYTFGAALPRQRNGKLADWIIDL